MPRPEPTLTREAVAEHARRCFRAGDTYRIGAEVEFLTVWANDPLDSIPLDALSDPLDGIATGGRISFEPGGQIELSSTPTERLDLVIGELRADLAAIRDAYEPHGIALAGVGLDPIRPPRRIMRGPRYDAMETYFDMDGPAGALMMTRTASIQVNLDLGREPGDRWQLAHRIGPILAAMFANSPFYCGASSGWASSRLWNWSAMDATRTSPVGGDGPDAWARYLRDARVMLIRDDVERFIPMLRPLEFEGWMNAGHPAGYPTLDDLAYHATTVFPPIRPRGHLEIRVTDALPDPWWSVPIAMWAILLGDDTARATAATIPPLGEDAWRCAARDGLTAPGIAEAARILTLATLEAMPRWSADPSLRADIEAFAERWTFAGRSPADDARDSAGGVTLERIPVTGAAWI
jgi:glutamate--cysteine ligase